MINESRAGRFTRDEAGRRGCLFPVGTGSHSNIINRGPLQSHRYQPAFRRQIEAVHRLGPVVLGYLVEELAGGRDLRATIAEYAAIDPRVVAAYGGDRLPPALHAIGGT